MPKRTTFSPGPLTALGTLITSRGIKNLGVVGDAAHLGKGTSYHLGRDELRVDANSRALPRDVAGLSNAASAIDVGLVNGDIVKLRQLSLWLVGQCLAGAPDTHDIREIIFSADGKRVDRWDGMDGTPGVVRKGPGQGDDSHLKHTHISYFRDSENRDKVGLFRRFFEEGDVRITLIKGEDWLPTPNATTGLSNGVFREVPERGAPIVHRVDLGVAVRSIAEVLSNGQNWRLTEHDGRPAYLLRSDWTPVVQGGDPAVDGVLDAYIQRTAG